METLYWITYVAAPIVGGALALAGILSMRPTAAGERSLAPVRAGSAVVLVASAVYDSVDFAQIVGGLNWKGRVLFVAIVLAQLGLGSLAALGALGVFAPAAAARTARLRQRLERGRRRLAVGAIVCGVAMVLVRARVWLQIFS